MRFFNFWMDFARVFSWQHLLLAKNPTLGYTRPILVIDFQTRIVFLKYLDEYYQLYENAEGSYLLCLDKVLD